MQDAELNDVEANEENVVQAAEENENKSFTPCHYINLEVRSEVLISLS